MKYAGGERWAERLALGWLGALVLLAAAAPFVASGLPLVVWEDGAARWPLFASVDAASWGFAGATLAAAVLMILPGRRGRPRALLAATIAATACLMMTIGTASQGLIGPRAEIDAGARVLSTLVPWSPFERQQDRDKRFMAPMSRSDAALAGEMLFDVRDEAALDEAKKRELAGRAERLALPDAARRAVGEAVNESNTGAELRAKVEGILEHSGRLHVLGTDGLGQDALSLLVHGSRMTVAAGLIAAGLATIIGIVIGGLMGWFGGVLDLLLSRVVEVFQSIPLLFVVVAAVAVMPRSTLGALALIGCFSWTAAARYTRAEFKKLRRETYIDAARAAAIPTWSILLRHVLPGAAAPALVDGAFSASAAVVVEATLSYLALTPPEQVSWGRLLRSATTSTGEFVWWMAVFPGAALFLTALSYNCVGEAVRRRLNPRDES